MSKQIKRRRRPKALLAPQKNAPPSFAAKSTPTQSKFKTWCMNFCSNADGAAVMRGMDQLGPIVAFEDLIVAAGNGKPEVTLAAEQILHLVEGWRYASAAISACLVHGSATATHLAYYAELRAAMSLFAGSGMRVRRKDYYYIDKSGAKVSVPNQATHLAVWELWNLWAKRPDAQNLLLKKVQLCAGVSFGDVLSTLQYTNSVATLQGWGFDLLGLSDDHNARNRASYEAYWLDSPLTSMSIEDVEIVRDLWRLFLNDGPSLAFDEAFVSHVANHALDAISLADETKSREKHQEEIAKNIEAATGIPSGVILRRLSGKHPYRPFQLASSKNTATQNVLCRAFFLLRLALLSVKGSLASTANNAARDWLRNWLTHAGIWSATSGVDLLDVEEDYRIAVMELTPSMPLPEGLWTALNLSHSARLARPDACIAWGLAA